MKYFDTFPKIIYDNFQTRNIISKVKLKDVLDEDFFSFANYTIETYDKPWTIANDYYGSVDRIWLVYLSNDIVDPFYEWHMDTYQFEEYLIKKYGSIENSKNTIDHYVDNNGLKYSPDSYTYSSSDIKATLTPKTAYRVEDENNESKRNIRLLRSDLAGNAESALKQLMR
tara:strand:- start:308 stop:817 length:510 start_codon:yes stop_codon:yes gene_type:complete